MGNLPTGSQTVGPYFHIGLTPLNRNNLVVPGVPGQQITIEGRMLDGNAQLVPDGLIETWQANAAGKYAHDEDRQNKTADPNFKGFARIPTDENGFFKLITIKPGSVPGPGGSPQAPHIVVTVFSRGLLRHLLTRIYFPDEPGNASDPVLQLVPAERRSTLIARRIAGRDHSFEWNVVMQGAGETVFFEF